MSASGSASKRQRLSELQAEIDAEEQATVQQLQEEKNAAEEKCRELETDLGIQTMQYESVQQALLFHLPRYSRYSQMKKVILDEGDPTRTFLKQHFKKSVLAHRRRHGEPHKEPPKLKVLRIERIHNPRLQEKYLAEVQDIAGLVERRVTPLDILAPPAAVESYHGLKLNEFLLYHGAPHDIVERLSMQGLDPRYAGENAGKLFGAGSYFAANSSKSDIYTTPNAAGERCILICRVCLGEGSLTKESCPSVTRPPERPDGRGPLNSIVAVTQSNGGCVEHPEFIVFKEAQALPEFAIWYKHRAGCQCTHCYEPPIDFVISFPEATAVDPALADWQCKLRASQKVDDLKKWVLIKFIIPIDDQQITMASANGQPVVLDDDQRTLAHYSVVNGSTLKVSGRPRLVRVLMEELGKDTLVRWMIPIGCTVQAVKKKVVEFCDADENDFVLTYKGHQLPLNWQTLDAAGVRLPAVMRARGIAAIFVRTLTAELLVRDASDHVADFRLEISRDRLAVVVGSVAVVALEACCANAVSTMLSEPPPHPPRLLLRRTKASNGSGSGKHIGFHRDHALMTVNVALNNFDAFRGGKLLMVTPHGERRFDERRAGHAVAMDGALVHAVSSLTAGVRYGLFAVHESSEGGPDHGFPFILADSLAS